MKLVHSLQQKALDSTISISELLRLANVIAVKLNLEDFEKWLKSEMSGYKNTDDLPDYRLVHGVMVSFNPVYGWQQQEIQSEIASIEPQLKSPNPKLK